MPGRPQWPLALAVTRPQPLMRVEAQRQPSRARWPLARVVTRPQSATQLRAGLLSLSYLGFDFIRGWCGLDGFPDYLKPPIATGANVVVDRRCGALSDHCLGGTLGVLAQCETRSSAVHRFLLLKTTTHTLLSAAQSTGLRGLPVSMHG